MFDHRSSHTTTLTSCPEAAVRDAPTRIEVNGSVFWWRPSNVLRVRAHQGFASSAETLLVEFSDGKHLQFYESDVGTEAIAACADRIAAALWPTGGAQ